MVTQFMQADGQQKMNGEVRGRSVLFTAVFLGFLLAMLATIVFPGLSSWGLLGMGMLCMGIAWVVVAILSQRIYKKAQWGMVVAGQIMGAIAILLLLFATI